MGKFKFLKQLEFGERYTVKHLILSSQHGIKAVCKDAKCNPLADGHQSPWSLTSRD